MWIMIIELVIALLWMVATISLLLIFRDRFRALGALTPGAIREAKPPTLSIIVPARNEEANITNCLEGLLHQDYPREHLQIIVVDDHSDDRTATAVQVLAREHPHLTLLIAPALPDGWRGKQNACWVAAQQTQADWLLFLDADTTLAPGLISAAISEARSRQLDMLSLHPDQEMRGFWERLLMPTPLLTLMLLMDARRINDPAKKNAMANGQFILIRSEAYFSMGGHRRVRAAVLEDVALAGAVKRNGYRIAIRGGGDLIRTRMYQDLPTLWAALARNGSELFGPLLTSFAVLNAFFSALFPVAFPLWLAAGLIQESTPTRAAAFIASTIGMLTWYAMNSIVLRKYDVPLKYLLLLPLSGFLIGLVNLHGLLQRLFRRRSWKGRRI